MIRRAECVHVRATALGNRANKHTKYLESGEVDLEALKRDPHQKACGRAHSSKKKIMKS